MGLVASCGRWSIEPITEVWARFRSVKSFVGKDEEFCSEVRRRSVGKPWGEVIPYSLLLRSILMTDFKFSVWSMERVISTLLQMTNNDAHSPIRTLLSGFKITPDWLEYPVTATHILVPFERSYKNRQVYQQVKRDHTREFTWEKLNLRISALVFAITGISINSKECPHSNSFLHFFGFVVAPFLL